MCQKKISKVKFYFENKREWAMGKGSNYMNILNKMEDNAIFKAKSRMLKVKK